MSQRQKARDFLRREGHGDAIDASTAKRGDKSDLVHKHHHGRPALAKSHTVHDGAEMGDDGLMRGHVKGV